MRILLDYRPALRARTGVGEYVHEMARALVATATADESLLLFSSSWKDRLASDAVPGAQSIDWRIPVGALNLAWHRLGWPPLEWLSGVSIDVAQSFHPLLMPSTHAARLVTIHDLDFLDHPERTGAEIRRDYPTLAAAHARRADQVIVNSRHTAQEVERRLHVPASRITVCRPGAPAWSAREAEPATGGCILFLGTLEPRKNLYALLDAYERVIAAWPLAPPLVLAGRVTEAAAPIVERTRRAPLAGHVELPGYVDADARLALYRRALVFVMPSHTEGFGMPVVEAMIAGVPVIAANRGALPEATGPAGRLVDPDDAAAFAQTLREVLIDKPLRDRMRDEGRRHARTFSWTDSARRLREGWALALEHRRQRHG
ncbi:MAG: glycosyltransferase family 1 protein [Acidobacteriota bacterium]